MPPSYPPPTVPLRGNILFSYTQFWAYQKPSTLNLLGGLVGRESLKLTDADHASLFVFTCLDPEKNMYAIQCVDRAADRAGGDHNIDVAALRGNYVNWDYNRFAFAEQIAGWEHFEILPMNEHGHEYFVIKSHMGYVDADGKGSFKVGGNGVRCYITPK